MSAETKRSPLELSDDAFLEFWFNLPDEGRDEYPNDVRAQCFKRYGKLTGKVSSAARAVVGAVKQVFETKEELTHSPLEFSPELRQLWDEGMPGGSKTGWHSVDEHYTVARGQITILTGWPGSGKSEWLDALLINLSRQNWKFAIFSAENQPVELHLAKLLEKISGRPFGAGLNQRIERDELPDLLLDLDTSFKFITTHTDAISIQDIVKVSTDWLLTQDGRIPGLIIDPWNELEHWRPHGKSETEYISETLSFIRNWARSNGVHVWIVAHPQKIPRIEGKLPVPRPDMISGSQHWWNKADCAITVFRAFDDEIPANHVEIHIQKIRFKNIGKIGMVTLKYDKINGRYSDLRNLYSVKDN